MNKEWLYQKYHIEELSIRQIAKQINSSYNKILKYMKEYDIPRRNKSQALSGIKNPMFGKRQPPKVKEPKQKMTPEKRNKISCFMKERWNLTEVREKMVACAKARTGNKNSFYGKHHSPETKTLLSNKNRGRFLGRNGSNWQGGKTPLNHKIRNCDLYSEWRNKVFERDGYTCQVCGKVGRKLNADHIKPFSLILSENNITNFESACTCEELWNLDNGRTLCQLCHKNTETYGWGSFWTKRKGVSND